MRAYRMRTRASKNKYIIIRLIQSQIKYIKHTDIISIFRSPGPKAPVEVMMEGVRPSTPLTYLHSLQADLN